MFKQSYSVTCKNNAIHEACGYSTTIKRDHTKEKTTSYYRGKDCISKLCTELCEKATELFNTEMLPMDPLTFEEQQKYNDSRECYICKKKFIFDKKSNYYKNFMKVRDHNHYTGKYRGAAHSICNLRYKIQKDIPVVTRDGRNNDFHLIITELAKEFRAEIHCIPEDKEKYKAFSVPIFYREVNGVTTNFSLRFIDSARFMPGSLDTHVNNLSELYVCGCQDDKKKQIIIEQNDEIVYTHCMVCTKRSRQTIESLKNKFPCTYQLSKGNMELFILLLRKGVCPYEYIDSWKRFDETELPSTVKFYSELNFKNIIKDEFKHAQKVWSSFNIKNLGGYHDLYVQSDTTQLADVFEKFRSLCLKQYELDPVYFCMTPGLAMEACLKMTNVKLELLTDIDMVLMFEKEQRERVSEAIHRYATASNKYIPNYNPQQPSSFLMYLDANNLYGWAMCKKLPIIGYMWAKNLNKYTCDFVKNYDENSDLGYLLEVDTKYPIHLHGSHSDLPFLPIKQNKLLTTLEDKKQYVVHISALKQALTYGLELEKVYRVITFNQSAWLKPYIDKNTELRQNAKNEFEKDFFKLMNNLVFGKTMENVRNYRDVKLIVTEERRKKLTSEPNYDSCKQFTEDLMAIEMRKTEVLMDKPIPVGQAILDISKTLMYEFYYDYLKIKYQDKVKLCYMDTDSFILDIKTIDFFEDTANDVDEWFDTSKYDKNDKRPLGTGKNEKVIGKFKD